MDRRTLVVAVVIGVASGLAGALWARRDVAAPATAGLPVQGQAADAPTPVLGGAARRQPAGAQATLEVRVVRGGRGVAGAEVLLWGFRAGDLPHPAWVEAGADRTNEAGLSRFAVGRGPLLVVAQEGGERSSQVVDVAPGDEPERAELELGRLSSLSGRVVEAGSGTPVAGARVTAVSHREELPAAEGPPAGTTETVTDSLGRFTVAVSAGEVVVAARAARYVPQRRLLSAPGEPVTLELERAARLEGVVVTSEGAPVAGATVTAEPGVGLSALTGGAGQFALEVPAGRVTVDAASPTGRHAVAVVTTAGGELARGVRLVIDEGSAVDGVVRDADTRAVEAGVTVRLLAEPDAIELARAQTGADGAFHFVAIPRQRFSVRASRGGGARGERIGLEVPGEPIEVLLRAPASVSGRVTDAGGRPVAGAEVSVSWARAAGLPPQRARSDAEGAFAMDDLLPGALTVAASFGAGQSRDEEVYLAPGGAASVALVLEGLGRLRGTVHGPGSPFVVFVRSQDRHFPGARVEASPDFSVDLLPGRYVVTAVSRAQGRLVRFDHQHPVEVRVGEETRVSVEVLPDAGSYDLPGSPEQGVSFDNVAGNVEISWIASDSPGFRAGLRQGDVVLDVDGQLVRDSLAAFQAAKGEGGRPVTYRVRREGVDRTFSVGR